MFVREACSLDDYTEKVVLERVKTERGEIQLQRRGKHFEIIENGAFIMASYNGESEKRLIDIAFEHFNTKKPINVLIGGLGVGYTLQAALEHRNVKHVTVIEIEDTVVEWNLRYFQDLNGNALKNPKTKIIISDFSEYLAQYADKYDMIALDIDNGPDWVVYNENKDVYKTGFLKILKEHLTCGGSLSIWSATRSEQLFVNLGKVFTNVKMEKNENEGSYIFLSVNGPGFHIIS
jgi:spermidine synthase